MLSMKDFWIVATSSECYGPSWASLSGPRLSSAEDGRAFASRVLSGQDFDISIDFWLDRQSGKKLGDMPACDGAMFVVSPRMHEILKPFFGVSVESRVVSVCSEQVGDTNYWILSVKEGAGPQDLKRGEVLFVMKSMGEFSGLDLRSVKAYGVYFDVETWSGVDVFRLGPRGCKLIVTEQVAHELKEAGLVGVDVTRLDQYGLDDWERYVATGRHPLLP